jgi:hypothetical protein
MAQVISAKQKAPVFKNPTQTSTLTMETMETMTQMPELRLGQSPVEGHHDKEEVKDDNNGFPYY